MQLIQTLLSSTTEEMHIPSSCPQPFGFCLPAGCLRQPRRGHAEPWHLSAPEEQRRKCFWFAHFRSVPWRCTLFSWEKLQLLYSCKEKQHKLLESIMSIIKLHFILNPETFLCRLLMSFHFALLTLLLWLCAGLLVCLYPYAFFVAVRVTQPPFFLEYRAS